MRWTRTLIPTLKESPHGPGEIWRQLLVRAGLMRQQPGGRIALLPLGYRVLHKAAQLVHDVLNAAGWSEVVSQCLEPPAQLFAAEIRSHKQLPVLLYQIGRDADHVSLLSGLSFHADQEGLLKTNEDVRSVFGRMTDRASVRPITARTANGDALLIPSSSGPDELITSDRGNYSATRDGAEIGSRPWGLAGEPVAELEMVHTPGMPSIETVCKFLQMAPRQMLKTLVFQVTSTIPVNFVVAVVQGDHHVNEAKLAKAAEAMGVTHIEMVDSPQVREKFALGFVGPDAGTKVPDAVLIVDPDAAHGERAWAAGANETDFHVKNFNWFRECGDRLADPTKTLVADIRNALPGDPSPLDDGGTLRIEPAMELARITQRADAFGATFDDETGQKRPILALSFRFDLLRFMNAVVESNHDEHGIRWPVALAPCSVVITPIKYEGAVKEAADKLHTQLVFEGIDTILDDRDARAGFKFADADLIGFPLRINVGEKNLNERKVELKLRSESNAQVISIDDVVPRVRAALTDYQD